MFSDESTFRLVRGTSNLVRRSSGASRYDPKYTVKTVKHLDSVMMWGAFSGDMGRAGLYFLPKNVTMKSANYIEVLRDHMLIFWWIHDYNFFYAQCSPSTQVQSSEGFPKNQQDLCSGVAW